MNDRLYKLRICWRLIVPPFKAANSNGSVLEHCLGYLGYFLSETGAPCCLIYAKNCVCDTQDANEGDLNLSFRLQHSFLGSLGY